MKYIDADKLKVEVKRLQGYAKAYLYGSERQSELSPTQYRMEGAESFCLSILSFIYSLQQEQPELPDNLDEAAKEYDETESWSYEALPYPRRAAFKEGAKWMARQMKQEQPEMDFEKEVRPIWENKKNRPVSFKEFVSISRHFWNKGYNARKEE